MSEIDINVSLFFRWAAFTPENLVEKFNAENGSAGFTLSRCPKLDVDIESHYPQRGFTLSANAPLKELNDKKWPMILILAAQQARPHAGIDTVEYRP